MEDFEDEIKIALTRIKRSELKTMLQEHEEASFDAETKAAFNRLERDRLKKKLIEHAEGSGGGIPEVPSIGSKSPFNNYLKFAAAACVIIGIGVFLFQQIKKPQEQLANAIENPKEIDSLNKPKENIAINKPIDMLAIPSLKPKVIVSFGFVIKSNDFGFSNDNTLRYSNEINSDATQLKYTLNGNSLRVHSNESFLIESVKSLNNQLYINANGKYYLIEETKSKKSLIEINDANIETELNKIL